MSPCTRPSRRPLRCSGRAGSAALVADLDEAGVRVRTSTQVTASEAGHLVANPGARDLSGQRVVALPRATGNPSRGVAVDERGSVLTHRFGRAARHRGDVGRRGCHGVPDQAGRARGPAGGCGRPCDRRQRGSGRRAGAVPARLAWRPVDRGPGLDAARSGCGDRRRHRRSTRAVLAADQDRRALPVSTLQAWTRPRSVTLLSRRSVSF